MPRHSVVERSHIAFSMLLETAPVVASRPACAEYVALVGYVHACIGNAIPWLTLVVPVIAANREPAYMQCHSTLADIDYKSDCKTDNKIVNRQDHRM